jgi:hypothetical protein
MAATSVRSMKTCKNGIIVLKFLLGCCYITPATTSVAEPANLGETDQALKTFDTSRVNSGSSSSVNIYFILIT